MPKGIYIRNPFTEEHKRKLRIALEGNENSLGYKNFLGYKHSIEAKRKISKNNARYWLGKKFSEEYKKKIKTARARQIITEETKKKMRESRKKYLKFHQHPCIGKKYSEEYKRKLGKLLKGKKHSEFFIGKLNSSNINEYRKQWRNRNPLKIKFYTYKRKERMEKGGGLTLKTIQRVYEDNIKQFGTLTCYLCLDPILFGKDHLEHKIPLSRGGTNIRENLAIACGRCNCKKYNKTEEEYRKEIFLNHEVKIQIKKEGYNRL